VVKNKVYL